MIALDITPSCTQVKATLLLTGQPINEHWTQSEGGVLSQLLMTRSYRVVVDDRSGWAAGCGYGHGLVATPLNQRAEMDSQQTPHGECC